MGTKRKKRVCRWVLPRLPSKVLDALPKRLRIHDKELALRSITHSSLLNKGAVARKTLLPAKVARDYEKLEHFGDSVIISSLIYQHYPTMGPGPSTILRAQVCANSTLAQISVHLQLPLQLRAPKSTLAKLRNSKGVQADLFEAHIGALHLSVIPIPVDYFEQILEPVVLWAFTSLQLYQQGPPKPNLRPTFRASSPSSSVSSSASDALNDPDSTSDHAADGDSAATEDTEGDEGSDGDSDATESGAEDGMSTTHTKTYVPRPGELCLSDDQIDLRSHKAVQRLKEYFDIANRGTWMLQMRGEGYGPFTATCTVCLEGFRYIWTSSTRRSKKLARAAAAWEICRELRINTQ